MAEYLRIRVRVPSEMETGHLSQHIQLPDLSKQKYCKTCPWINPAKSRNTYIQRKSATNSNDNWSTVVIDGNIKHSLVYLKYVTSEFNKTESTGKKLKQLQK